MNARKLTAADVCVGKKLLEYGQNARAAQIKDKNTKDKELRLLETKRIAAEEEKKLQETVRKDKERLSELKRLEMAKLEADKVKTKASEKALEAELRLQQAMKDLRDAHKECEDASQVQQQFVSQKEV